MDFVAIDFETANAKRSSICMIGAVKVIDGEIVDRIERYVYPAPGYFGRRQIEVHGITMEDVEDCPLFPEVWAEIDDFIDGYPLVAHNAAFERSCINAAFYEYDMGEPDYEYYCTYREAQEQLADELESFGLDTVADYYDIGFEHHDALEDAEACAQIAMHLFD